MAQFLSINNQIINIQYYFKIIYLTTFLLLNLTQLLQSQITQLQFHFTITFLSSKNICENKIKDNKKSILQGIRKLFLRPFK